MSVCLSAFVCAGRHNTSKPSSVGRPLRLTESSPSIDLLPPTLLRCHSSAALLNSVADTTTKVAAADDNECSSDL